MLWQITIFLYCNFVNIFFEIYLKNYVLNDEFDFSSHDFSRAKKQLEIIEFLKQNEFYFTLHARVLPVFSSVSTSNVTF